METIPFPAGKPKKLEGRTGALYLKANGGKQAVEVTDESLVPDELCTVTVTMTLTYWTQMRRAEYRRLMRLQSTSVSRESVRARRRSP